MDDLVQIPMYRKFVIEPLRGGISCFYFFLKKLFFFVVEHAYGFLLHFPLEFISYNPLIIKLQNCLSIGVIIIFFHLRYMYKKFFEHLNFYREILTFTQCSILSLFVIRRFAFIIACHNYK